MDEARYPIQLVARLTGLSAHVIRIWEQHSPVLRGTGNLDCLRDWILSLREPYDRNNAGETEADNLGQALFLISLVCDKAHPLVSRVLAEVPKFERRQDEKCPCAEVVSLCDRKPYSSNLYGHPAALQPFWACTITQQHRAQPFQRGLSEQ